eukprot:INCI5003.19.p2 GENE.INCI5003.19~~INCI5003.19.p2  ORF type:complete len:633 (+),score=120.43 INCI5003.19:142-1899(+)
MAHLLDDILGSEDAESTRIVRRRPSSTRLRQQFSKHPSSASVVEIRSIRQAISKYIRGKRRSGDARVTGNTTTTLLLPSVFESLGRGCERFYSSNEWEQWIRAAARDILRDLQDSESPPNAARPGSGRKGKGVATQRVAAASSDSDDIDIVSDFDSSEDGAEDAKPGGENGSGRANRSSSRVGENFDDSDSDGEAAGVRSKRSAKTHKPTAAAAAAATAAASASKKQNGLLQRDPTFAGAAGRRRMKAQQRAVASDSEDEVDKIDSHFESDSQDDGEGEEAKIVSRRSRSKGSKTRGKAHSSHAAESKNSSRKHGKRVNSKKATILDNWDDDDNEEDDDEDENVSPPRSSRSRSRSKPTRTRHSDTRSTKTQQKDKQAKGRSHQNNRPHDASNWDDSDDEDTEEENLPKSTRVRSSSRNRGRDGGDGGGGSGSHRTRKARSFKEALAEEQGDASLSKLALRRKKSSGISRRGSGVRLGARYIGGPLQRKAVREDLNCIKCDMQVLCFQGCRWDPDAVNYVFFRNNIFHPDRLPPVQISDPACSAYACQCSWQSVSALKEISRSGMPTGDEGGSAHNGKFFWGKAS